MDSIGNYAATGGISGAIMVGVYMAYKCCYRKKFKSNCCGASMDISVDVNAPPESPASVPEQSKQTQIPRLSATPTPSSSPLQEQTQTVRQPSELIL